MAVVLYNRGATRIAAGDTPLDSADLRILIIAGASLPAGWSNKDLNTVADLDAVTGLDIHTERLPLGSETVTQDDANDRANVAAAMATFAAAAGVTARAAVVYDEGGGTDATRHLIAGSSTGYPQPMDGGLEVPMSPWMLVQQGS